MNFGNGGLARFVGLALVFALAPWQWAWSAEEPLVLGIFPRLSAAAAQERFAPFATYLSKELKREVKFETAPDQDAFWKAVTEKRFDIVHYNQMNYIESHDKFGYNVIAMNEEFGKSTVAGAIVVRKDSGIHALTDLRGKNIIFGSGPRGMVAYIANVALLREAGLKKGDYKESFAKNPAEAMVSVFKKEADAGGTGDIGLRVQAVESKIDTNELKMVVVGPQLAHAAWAVKGSLGPDFAKKVQNAMLRLNMPDGQALLDNAQLSGMVLAKDADYDSCRKIVKDVLGDQAVK